MNFLRTIIVLSFVAFLGEPTQLSAMRSDSAPGSFKEIHNGNRYEQIENIKSWIDRGGDINATTQDGRSLVCLAIALNDTDLVKSLLDNGANIQAMNDNSYSPLNTAVNSGNTLYSIELLLDRGANVNATDRSGKTPLIAAVEQIGRNDFSIREWLVNLINLLLERGADINGKSRDGMTPLVWVITHNRNPRLTLSMAKLLLQKGAQIDEKAAQVIFYMGLYTGDKSWSNLLTSNTIENIVNKTNQKGETVLMQEVIRGRTQQAEFLIQHGANPHIKDASGFDVFDYAQSNPAMITLLSTHFPEEMKKRPYRTPRYTASKQKLLTPTEVHYAKFDKTIQRRFGEVLQDPLAQECIKKERFAYQQGKYVFYRAEPGKFRVYQLFLQELHALIRSFNEHGQPFIFTRFFKDAPQEHTINEYIDSGKCNAFSPASSAANVILSANIPLFGNVEDEGECTWYYFLSNQGIAQIDLHKEFEYIFNMYDFNKKYIDELLALQQGSLELAASLQQIIIPNDIVDNVVMLAEAGNCSPWPKMIDQSCWDPQKGRTGRHTCIASIIDKYRQEKIEINDALQARLFANAAYGLNPESGIEFHLYTRLPKGRLAYFKKQVKQVADKIFSEWLVRQIHSQNVPAGMESTELQHALKIFGKGDKDRQEAFFKATREMRTPEQEVKAVRARTSPGEAEEESKEAMDPLTRANLTATAQQAARLAQEKAKENIQRFPSMERKERLERRKRKSEQAQAEQAAWQKYHQEEAQRAMEEEAKSREAEAGAQQERAEQERLAAEAQAQWQRDIEERASLYGF